MAEITNARISREQEKHVAEPVHEEYNDRWEEQDMLSTDRIPAREGFVQRWVRTSTRGQEDQSNIFKKMNKGWKPRLKDSVPKGQYVMSVGFQGAEVIGILGMILMERPLSFQLRERRGVEESNSLQEQAVEQNMFRIHEPGNGKFTRPKMNVEKKVSTGRRPVFDDD